MPSQYIPILIFAVLAAAFPAVTLVLFRFIRPTPVAVGAKLKPYECGVEAEGDTRGRYSVRSQPAGATASANASDGDIKPSVLRGLLFSERAMALSCC